MVSRIEKERRKNREKNIRFLITTFIALIVVIISIYSLYMNHTHVDKIQDIERRLDKLEEEIYKPEPDSLEPSRETRYIDSSISNIQKDRTNAL